MNYFREDLKNMKPVNITVPNKNIKMGLNESSLNPFEIVKDEFIKKMKNVHINRYFNSITKTLRKQLADYAEVAPECLAFGNGADEMLYYLFNSVRSDNNSFAVSLAPSYFDYKSYSGAVGLGIKFLSLNSDFDFSVEEYLKLCDDDNCKLAILCNPNNPTGNLLDDNKIVEILTKSNRLVVIDETYFEFSEKTFADRIYKYPNLVIVRSFSKSFSAAGLRFGYIISHPDNIKELEKVMTIFHLNLMTQTIISTMLDNKNIFLEHTKKIIRNKEDVFQKLSAINGISVHPSATNFLTFSAGDKTEDLFKFLSQNDIAIRPVWHHPVLAKHVRVTISNAGHNAVFIENVKKFMKGE
ncbi:MAG: histidinol-phosphate aminotransferase family protein [Candidatus Cloacimonetes bacterium]|jgi:histidinol-phosphate aminotransferase|nr:histidinol-phosphate aminotransferase family protein [Candidatus Cloacimonadota bacterium]